MVATATQLDAAIRAVCPNIDGVRVVDPNDKTTWVIWFQPSATVEQQAAAQTALESFTF